MAVPSGVTATEICTATKRGDYSVADVIDAALQRCHRVQAALNPFTEIYGDDARQQAAVADHALQSGGAIGPLHGVPVAIKDFTPLAGKRTTRGSKALRDWIPDDDPVIVQRLRAAGAIIIAKTTTPEFAHSSFTRSPLFGHTLNPWDASRSSGGSSGGAGVAVATGCVPLAEGTDMGGSVRIPAAWCGVVGLKPSLGRIPMDILPTVFDTISHFGPLARTVEDAALFLDVTSGSHEADILSQRDPMPLDGNMAASVAGLRLAISPTLDIFHLDPDVRANFEKMVALLGAAGAKVHEVSLGWDASMVDAWLDIWAVYLAAAVEDLMHDHRDDMDPEFIAFVDKGMAMSAVAYRRLDEIRTRQWHLMRAAMNECDALLCPTMAVPAAPFDAREDDYASFDDSGMLKGLDMTSLFNSVAPCPALTVPSGLSRDGLPTAIQIVGHRYDDPMVVRIGIAIERLNPWRPGLDALAQTFA